MGHEDGLRTRTQAGARETAATRPPATRTRSAGAISPPQEAKGRIVADPARVASERVSDAPPVEPAARYLVEAETGFFTARSRLESAEPWR